MTEMPKPHPFVKLEKTKNQKPAQTTSDIRHEERKKPFKRTPHLNQRPFMDDPRLVEFRNTMDRQK